MTEEELKKKAEIYIKINDIEMKVINLRFRAVEEIKQAYIAGAEFGYNKANEWHFIKDGDLPKENQLVLLYRENPNGTNVALTHWYKSYVNDKVIAWKEIVPPKELEE